MRFIVQVAIASYLVTHFAYMKMEELVYVNFSFYSIIFIFWQSKSDPMFQDWSCKNCLKNYVTQILNKNCVQNSTNIFTTIFNETTLNVKYAEKCAALCLTTPGCTFASWGIDFTDTHICLKLLHVHLIEKFPFVSIHSLICHLLFHHVIWQLKPWLNKIAFLLRNG